MQSNCNIVAEPTEAAMRYLNEPMQNSLRVSYKIYSKCNLRFSLAVKRDNRTLNLG